MGLLCAKRERRLHLDDVSHVVIRGESMSAKGRYNNKDGFISFSGESRGARFGT
jgi:hypothetical protein